MNAVRAYLLRLVVCGFLVSLAQSMTAGARLKRILTLCGGCLLLLTALRPLVRVDWSALPDRLGDLGLERPILSEEEARAKNEALLAELVARQTEDHIRAWAIRQGLDLRAEVTVELDPQTGLPVPVSVVLRGALSPEARDALGSYLTRELGIPAERQVWREVE